MNKLLNQKEKWKEKLLKVLSSDTLILFYIYIVVIPVWAAFFLDLIEFSNIKDFDSLKIIVPVVALTGLLTSTIWRKWWAVPCFLPAIFYFTGLGVYGGLGWFILFAITVYAFICMVIKGHIRSFLYLFLIVYSAYFLDLRMAFLNGVTYAFLRFVYLALNHNIYVFTTLGLNKSLSHLLKALLYWSPLLILILPIKYVTTNVNRNITEQIYRFTVVDSVEFQRDTNQSIATHRFQLRPNVTTVLLLDSGQRIVETSLSSSLIGEKLDEALKIPGGIDSSHRWMIEQFIDTNLVEDAQDHFYSAYLKDRISGKGSPIIENYFSENCINFEDLDKHDSIASLALTRVLSRRDPLREKVFEIGLNNIEYKSNWLGEVNKNNMVLTELRQANNLCISDSIKSDYINLQNLLSEWVNDRKQNAENSYCHLVKVPTAIILKDIALDTEPTRYGSLEENINGAMITTFKRFTNALIARINQEIGGLDLGSIAERTTQSPVNVLDEGIEQVDSLHKMLLGKLNDKEIEFMTRINVHRLSTHAVVTEEYNAIFPEPLLELEKCSWYDVMKLATNAIKKSVNKQYSKQKNNTKQKIDKRINDAYARLKGKVRDQFDSVEGNLNKVHAQIQLSMNNAKSSANELVTSSMGGIDFSRLSNINEMIPNMIKETNNAILSELIISNKRLFMGLMFYSLFGTISFLYLIMQTYLYVFARVTVSRKNKVYVSLNSSKGNHPQGSIKKWGDGYTIDAAQKHTYYVSRKFEPSGCPPRFAIPFKKTSVISRLKSKTYFMNKVEMKGQGSSVDFRAIGSQEFVEWTLEEGEEVTFDLKNLVAMSDTLKLKSEVSFRVTTLILGKLFHKMVKGPGKLILMTEGRPIISGEKSSDNSLAQNRIIAYNKSTRFEISSELNIADVYMSGFYLQKMPEDLIIIDADAHGKPSLGLIQYVKGLINPF
ncbi:MAG: hypothetical protein GQ564_14780 [Bacteroidales bacterium]|nr:hypothetical protein [Bacteroidales bacterium]